MSAAAVLGLARVSGVRWAEVRCMQVYKQNDRLVQHIAKQHAEQLQAVEDAANPRVFPFTFSSAAPLISLPVPIPRYRYLACS
jgi:hypothetical protein